MEVGEDEEPVVDLHFAFQHLLRRPKRKANKKTLESVLKKKNDLDGVEERIQRELKEIVDTVTELKNITEGALVDPHEIEEVEPELDEYGGIPHRFITYRFEFPSISIIPPSHTQTHPCLRKNLLCVWYGMLHSVKFIL